MSGQRRRRPRASRGLQEEDKRLIDLADAVDQLEEKRYVRADQLFSKLLAMDGPHDPSLLHFAGLARYQIGRCEEGLALLRRAVEAEPRYAEALNSLGVVLLEARRAAEALPYFERAVEAKPDYANAHISLGEALQAEGREGDAAEALRRGLGLAPWESQARARLAQCLLVLEAGDEALKACIEGLSVDPFSQTLLATTAIAEQICGSRKAGLAFYDFERFIHRAPLETPPGWKSLEDFNHTLADAVRSAPSLTWEPFKRVTRNGAVTEDLLLNPNRTIRTFERALRRAIGGYRDTLARDEGAPFLMDIPRRYRLTLIASILTEGGVHPPHIHEGGWLSGVYYVSVPAQIGADREGGGGWLEFGRPDHRLPQGADIGCVRHCPQAGTALMFPSYLYHGTRPFEGEGERIGIAFDAYPA